MMGQKNKTRHNNGLPQLIQRAWHRFTAASLFRWWSDKNKKQPSQDIVGRWGMRKVPYNDPQRDELLELLKNRMTFIMAGISNQKPFLMVDCVGSETVNGVKRFKYMNKLSKLISPENETYFCLTGSDSYDYAMSCIDREYYEKSKHFDFKNKEHILDLLDVFKRIKEYREELGYEVNNFARLYFLNREMACYYDISTNEHLSSLQSLNDGYFIPPYIAAESPSELDKIFDTNEELIDFCKEKIQKAQNYNIDLKDKFSYVIFDNNGATFNNSINNNKELVYALAGADYDKIENPTTNNT